MMQLLHLETHYAKVSGDQGVISASLAFRTALSRSITLLTDVNGADYRVDESQGEARPILEKSLHRSTYRAMHFVHLSSLTQSFQQSIAELLRNV